MANKVDKFEIGSHYLLDKLNNQLLFLCVWGLKLTFPNVSDNYATYLTELSDWGSFKSYVDKMRWVGGQKMLLFVHV